MRKISVLFICVHNSARSQLAEEFLRLYGGDIFISESAGTEPGKINPYVARSLQLEGIDISRKKTQSTFDLYRAGKRFNYYIAVCSEAEDYCPSDAAVSRKYKWPFPDPSTFRGSDVEIMAQVSSVKEGIRAKILEFIDQILDPDEKKLLPSVDPHSF